MTDFNLLLGGRFTDAIRRLLGEEVHVDTAVPELGLDVILENDRPEFYFLLDTVLMACGDEQPLNAAQNSAARIRNPPGSNTVVVVTDFVVASSVSSTLIWEYGLSTVPDLGTLSLNRMVRDGRWNGLGVGIVSMANNIGSGGNAICRTLQGPNVPTPLPYPVIVSPGSALSVRTLAINTNLDFGLAWYERRVRPEELQ